MDSSLSQNPPKECYSNLRSFENYSHDEQPDIQGHPAPKPQKLQTQAKEAVNIPSCCKNIPRLGAFGTPTMKQYWNFTIPADTPKRRLQLRQPRLELEYTKPSTLKPEIPNSGSPERCLEFQQRKANSPYCKLLTLYRPHKPCIPHINPTSHTKKTWKSL